MKAARLNTSSLPRSVLVMSAALLVAVATFLTGCSPEVANPSRVLQSVSVDLASDGAITTVNGSAVFVDEATGESRSTQTDFKPAEVVDDLPVRVSTQYRTGEANGPDLNDLSGFTGRVEIDITVENLTVSAKELSYDAAGQARTAAALVGTPLSIAASTELSGTAASRLVFDSADSGQSGTNGIVSSTTDGDAVVQWAALLAPPQSSATTVFRMVADVENFSVPVIDIAVQAGLNTDLSFEGVVNSAFDTSATSELALQQRTIELVTEVNSVLARAGATITEVRKNLDETSKTLGVSTAQELQRSSESLTASMKGLSGQIASLQTDLDSTVTGTNTLVNEQFGQIVDSMNAMLGDTSATLAEGDGLVDGTGCAAQVAAAESGDSLFSSVLQLSAQLKGYAEASAGCRDEIVQELAASIGPAEPTPQTCADSSSMTCALLGAQTSVLGALDDLVASGQAIVGKLDNTYVNDAISEYGALSATLTQIKTQIGTLSTPDDEKALDEQLTALKASLEDASDSLTSIQKINTTAKAAQADLIQGPKSVQAQYDELVKQICSLAKTGSATTGVDPKRIEAIRGLITDTPCDGSKPVTTSSNALENRLVEQQEHWQEIIDATDAGQPDSVLAEVDALLQSFGTALDPVISGTGQVDTAATQLSALIATADGHAATLDTLLGKISTQQQTLAASVTQSFEDAAETAREQIETSTAEQIRVVSAQAEKGRESLIESYNRTIAGLTATSDDVVEQTKSQIDTQSEQLTEEKDAVTAALDEQTAEALERIAEGTDGSTRDIEAADALLSDSLNKVILDLGDPQVQGSGLLGSMAASAAKADTADYQLALASQSAAGYANIRSEDIAGILLRQAQFQAALEQAETFPAFHIELPSGASWQTVYAFHVGGQQ